MQPALDPVEASSRRIDIPRSLPYFAVHLLALSAFLVEFRWWYPLVAVGLYFARMFFITGGLHRYFSHRTYKTSRWFQFVLAFLASTATQKGVLWWAAHHRDHHRYSDTEKDLHSPRHFGFAFAHRGWFLCRKFSETNLARVKDLARFPELLWLNRNWAVAPLALASLLTVLGGFGLFVWGYCVSTVLLWEGTFCINTVAHRYGTVRYKTGDDSRNNWWLALLMLGEGWHNNHHHYAWSVRQGFYWWEIDISFYILKLLSWVGLVWDLRGVPSAIRDAHLRSPTGDAGEPLLATPELTEVAPDAS